MKYSLLGHKTKTFFSLTYDDQAPISKTCIVTSDLEMHIEQPKCHGLFVLLPPPLPPPIQLQDLLQM